MKFTAAVAALLLSPVASFAPVGLIQGKREIALQATVEAPVREPETPERVREVRERFRQASVDANQAKGCVKEETGNEWWRTPEDELSRKITKDKPLRVIIAGGGVAGLVAASACHSKGMKVAIFEQASQYAPYGGPIQIQSNALRALQRIKPILFDEIVKAGTVTADRVSGLKIGYKKGVFMNLGQQYERGDWLVRFDTLQPALDAGLAATVVVDRPVIQQILLNHGIPEGTVRIKSRIASYEELGKGKGIKVTLTDGTVAYADALVGADGIWSSVRRIMHDLDNGADGFAASGAAGGALNEAEARKMAKDSVLMANNANRRYSRFTCYAALCEHRASNIEEVSYQILLGKDKYFVSTDGGGERQQWFALIREDAGGVDTEPSPENPTPKLTRLLNEFNNKEPGDQNGDVWDDFAHELLLATPEENIKRRDLYDGSPLVKKGWTRGQVAICGDAAHPMMPNLGQGGCQATEDGYRLAEELATVKHTKDVEGALNTYFLKRIARTTIIQIIAQLGSDLLVDFDLMMTIPLVGPFFLTMTQLSMPFILRFLYTPEF
uniref:FAD-binding domain-containing protein n=1 Tax=Leptocylindrus danicus TaxID=163516 RepID=A0A7S2KBG9_9STRA|mmetsp:Transcript_19990/g.29785  ORF Transcript_19990/g.29785 Transcript_19990/m.29785 type:complete len:555 (+) Transcript_19990:160-1824(+)|eukprot:CAMPEP_0116034170 /NCGR_PEP_ID=MMETSP0321-20121206/19438_1 /TAXON_ID=163516 /ORGANISM="Leptocylindrus danicus var. danicus, Strain B650" /LENGTH=554 /DNA_ID=CAMNT_0003510411 /DNA_START=2478 /DNA_END=4142 /DNA_ORIENTATION=-